jgi:hypothetical protein
MLNQAAVYILTPLDADTSPSLLISTPGPHLASGTTPIFSARS